MSTEKSLEEKKSNKKIADNFFREYSLKTIKGKLLALILFFLVILFSYTSIVLRQNEKIENLNENVVDTSYPVSQATSKILIGVDEAEMTQRGFLLTKYSKFRRERIRIWNEVINPSLTKLQSISGLLNSEQQGKVFELADLLIEYRQSQEKVDNYIINRSVASGINKNKEETNVLKSEKGLNTYIENYLLGENATFLKKIKAILIPLSIDQFDLLEEDLRSLDRDIEQSNATFIITSILAALFGLIFGIYLIAALKKSIKKPIEQLQTISRGELKGEEVSTNDELNEILEVGNSLKKNLEKASSYAISIGEGNFEAKFKPASEKDELGNALVQMSSKLKGASQIDQQQNWAARGIATFGEIIRQNEEDFNKLSDQIISNLIKYIGANQGGFFILNEGESEKPHLKLMSTYAYNKKKFAEKKLYIHELTSEGLVGQAYLEGETIYLTEAPHDFVNITSGLGGANPNYILIVPLKSSSRIEGIIELASFNEFQPYQISFVERLVEGIAAAIISIKANQRTRLLLEQSQQQKEQLMTQEEEMRQNVEELAATQEEMRKKQNELERLKTKLEKEVEYQTTVLSSTLHRYDLASKEASIGIWDVIFNDKYKTLEEETEVWWSSKLRTMLGYEKEEFENKFKTLADIIHPDDKEKTINLLNKTLEDTKKTVFKTDFQLKMKSGEYSWYSVIASVARDKENNPVRVAGIISDIEKLKKLEKEKDLRTNGEKFFQRVAANTPGVIYQYKYNEEEKKGTFSLLIHTAKDIIGKKIENIVSDASANIEIHPDHIEGFQKKIEDSAKNNLTLRWEGKVKVAGLNDYQYIWVMSEAVPREEDGYKVWDGVMFDTTEYKKKEQRLNNLQEKLKQQQEKEEGGSRRERGGKRDKQESEGIIPEEVASDLGIVMFKFWNDSERLVDHLSESVKEVLGYSTKDFRDKEILFKDLLPEEDRAFTLQMIKNKIVESTKMNHTYEVKYKILDIDGNPRLILERGKGVKNSKGFTSRVVGFMTDITNLRPNA